MSKIQKKQSRKPRIRMHVLTAAAVIAVLCVGAAAASYLGVGGFFQSFFAKNSGDLTPGQIETMDRIGQTFEEGVTSSGATITPVAALADRNVYYLRLRVEAPAGVVLPDLEESEGFYQLSGMAAGESMTLEAEKHSYKAFGYCTSLYWLPDDDPADNTKEAVILFTAQNEADFQFNDNIPKLLTIRGLWVQSPDKDYRQLFSGVFTFDIGTNYKSETLSLDCQDATCYVRDYDFTTTLEYLELSPLSYSYRFRATAPRDERVEPGLGHLQIVMKDGSVFLERGEDAEPADGPLQGVPTTTYEDYAVFDAPLDLSQVDYIKYGETILPIE